MFRQRFWFASSILTFAILAMVGCGGGSGGKLEVSGKVTLEGQPLKDGSIMFVPLDKEGTQGAGAIDSGNYKIPSKHGLKPGKYLVQITSGDGVTRADGGGNEEAGGPGGSTNIVSVDRVPEDWNVSSKQQVEVKSSGKNVFDFAIPNANPKAKKR